MPYIKKEERSALAPVIDALAAANIDTAGKLNYLLTMTCRTFLRGRSGYEAFNTVVGALECAKLELYRRLIVPYEDAKIGENGDLA